MKPAHLPSLDKQPPSKPVRPVPAAQEAPARARKSHFLLTPLNWCAALLKQWVPARALPALSLQPLGLSERELRALRPLLDNLERQLGLRISLGDADSELVLMNVDYAGRLPKAIVKARVGDRPALLVEVPGLEAVGTGWQDQQQDLLRQLCAVPLVREKATGRPDLMTAETQARTDLGGDAAGSLGTSFNSDFDSELQVDQLQGDVPTAAQRALVAHVLQGLHDESTAALVASYGDGAALRMDFTSRLVALDPQALQGLRVRRELPFQADGATLGERAAMHELDEVVWHLGIACGRFMLLDQPADHWHTALVGVAASHIERYSRQPRHLELARLLMAGPISPSALRRQVRISVPDLRRFLQACLFLGLVRWSS